MNEIPGVIPEAPTGPKTATLSYDRKNYSFELDVGRPLSFGQLGAIPKKILKRASKLWMKLNPPVARTEFPLSALKCRYHARVLLRPWLEEKAKAVAA